MTALRQLKVLQVCTRDRDGGAEKVARTLFEGLRAHGHASYFAVGSKRTDDADIFEIPNESNRSRKYAFWSSVSGRLRGSENPAARAAAFAARRIAEPVRLTAVFLGHEDFDFPGTRLLLDVPPVRPEIVHFHNLHGGYFDLRELPRLSREAVVMGTLHDTWLVSGHCAYSMGCQRWRTGCGHCPDLTIGPPVHRDATDYNWRRKQGIYASSKLYIATPCRWLRDIVNNSILAEGVFESRVIHYGIDLELFKPGDKATARAELGLPQDGHVLLFAAHGVRTNMFKDYDTIRAALATLPVVDVRKRANSESREADQQILFIALGGDGPPERVGNVDVWFVPFTSDPAIVVKYYQAADLFLHAARADTFPNTILEALACGTPVVATAVGGIPEQVMSLVPIGKRSDTSDLSKATGQLVEERNPEDMAHAVHALLGQPSLIRRLGENAVRDARVRFDFNRQLRDYELWYNEILDNREASGDSAE